MTGFPTTSGLLHPHVRLSESPLWQAQRSFYGAATGAAWGVGGVPNRATTNPLMARSVAELVLALAEDWGALDRGVDVVDLGCGTGRLGYRVAVELEQLRLEAGLEAPFARVVLADLSADNVKQLQAHPRLQPLLQSERLELACWDVCDPGPMHLLHGGARLGGRPMVVLANYLVDSVPGDAFVNTPAGPQELLVGLRGVGDPRQIEHLLQRSVVDTAAAPLAAPYLEGPLAELLNQVATLAPVGAAFTLPTTCLHALKALGAASGGQWAAIVGDKGFTSAESMKRGGAVTPQVHSTLQGAGFSLMVNFVALRVAFESMGGFGRLSASRSPQFCLSLFSACPAGRRTALAARTALDQRAPFGRYGLTMAAARTAESLDADAMLSLLELSAGDPDLLRELAQELVRKVGALKPARKRDLVRAMDRVWAMDLPRGPETLAAPIGAILRSAELWEDAARYGELALLGATNRLSALLHMGTCCEALGQLQQAKRWFRQAMAEDARDPRARRRLGGLLLDELERGPG